MRFLIFSLLLSCLLCGQSAFAQNHGASSSEQQTTQFDEKLLLGTWKVVSVSGKAVTKEMTMTFKSDYTFDQTKKRNDGTTDSRSGTWAFGKDLKSLDFIPANEKMTIVQIIRLDKEMFEFYDERNTFILKKVQ